MEKYSTGFLTNQLSELSLHPTGGTQMFTLTQKTVLLKNQEIGEADEFKDDLNLLIQ